MTAERRIKYYQAINEAPRQAMEEDPKVYLLGLGVPGPTGIFGTTSGLLDRFGPRRVLDMPSSESGMTGVALGSTIAGFRPVMVHMRVDFAILAMDQMVNQVAKWHFMYGGKMRAPMVFRMIIGRGWGQGPQHSQSLQAWFAHVPGFRVVMPTTPYDVKGMLIAAIRDDAPVVVFEHRCGGAFDPIASQLFERATKVLSAEFGDNVTFRITMPRPGCLLEGVCGGTACCSSPRFLRRSSMSLSPSSPDDAQTASPRSFRIMRSDSRTPSSSSMIRTRGLSIGPQGDVVAGRA